MHPNLNLMSEHQIQSQIVTYFNLTYPLYRKCLFHVQQTATNRIQGAIYKSLGVTSGVSDLILVADNSVYFIELKDQTGRQSEHQKTFEQQVTTLGHTYVIIRSLGGFIAFLNTIPTYALNSPVNSL